MSLPRNDSPARPKRHRLYAVAGVAVLVLAACASGGAGGKWAKAGASTGVLERDLAECQFQAQSVARSSAARDLIGTRAEYLAPAVKTAVNAQGQVVTTVDVARVRVPGAQSLQYLSEREHMGRCMAGRGYKRVSAAAG